MKPPFLSRNIILTAVPFSGHVFEVFDNVIGQIEHLVNQQIKSVKGLTGKPPKVRGIFLFFLVFNLVEN